MSWAGAATAAWVAGNLRARRHFRAALAEPQRAEAQVLEELLEATRGTIFARDHRLERVRRCDDLRAAVPARDYDELAPYIQRAADGEPDVLTNSQPRHKITGFEPSSGSAAAAKLIPSTALLRQQFQRGIGAWVAELYSERPALMAGRSYWSISPALPPRRTAGGLPIGFSEDSAYLGGLAKRLVDRAMAVPSAVAGLHDIDEFRRATLLYLLSARDLRLVSVWNPSFFSLLLDELEGAWGALVEQLRVGWRGPGLRLAPNPGRAAALTGLQATDLRGIWPRLGLVSCWADGSAAAPLSALLPRLRGVEVQPKGLLATEAFCSLPFGGGHPLAINAHLFELEREDGRVLWAHELAPGDRGTLIVSTGGGLLRYRLRDRVEVTGLVDRTPSLRFLGKEDRLSDLRGEKLHEAFVAEVLRGLGVGSGFAMLAPEAGEPPCYVLFVEHSPPNPEDLDRALRANPHYNWCRELGQLGPSRVLPVVAGAASAYIEACRRDGVRLGDIKATSLSSKMGWSAVLCPEVSR